MSIHLEGSHFVATDKSGKKVLGKGGTRKKARALGRRMSNKQLEHHIKKTA